LFTGRAAHSLPTPAHFETYWFPNTALLLIWYTQFFRRWTPPGFTRPIGWCPEIFLVGPESDASFSAFAAWSNARASRHWSRPLDRSRQGIRTSTCSSGDKGH